MGTIFLYLAKDEMRLVLLNEADHRLCTLMPRRTTTRHSMWLIFC
jgi:hypothetical protein